MISTRLMINTRLGTLALALALAAPIGLVACGGDSGGSDPTADNAELLTTEGFQQAYDAVESEVGAEAPILRLRISSGGAEFQIREGEKATGLIYSGGDLEPVDVTIVGGGSIEGLDFPLSEIDPAAIDRITDGVRESDVEDPEVKTMTLETGTFNGEFQWLVNVDGDGRTGLVFTADPDGSNVVSTQEAVDSAGEAFDEATKNADEVADCVAAAQTAEEITACAQQ